MHTKIIPQLTIYFYSLFYLVCDITEVQLLNEKYISQFMKFLLNFWMWKSRFVEKTISNCRQFELVKIWHLIMGSFGKQILKWRFFLIWLATLINLKDICIIIMDKNETKKIKNNILKTSINNFLVNNLIESFFILFVRYIKFSLPNYIQFLYLPIFEFLF